MTGSAEPLPSAPFGTSVADVLRAMGQLMQDCHRECLALQVAISAAPAADPDPDHVAAFQKLDHMTQVHEDLARLLPELAEALNTGVGAVDGLAEALRLISLRHRLFGFERGAPISVQAPGDVNFF